MDAAVMLGSNRVSAPARVPATVARSPACWPDTLTDTTWLGASRVVPSLPTTAGGTGSVLVSTRLCPAASLDASTEGAQFTFQLPLSSWPSLSELASCH